MASFGPNTIAQVVTVTPKPDKLEEALAQGVKFAKAVEDAEPGCLVYKVSKTKPLTGDGPEQVVMTMVFKDEAALKAHEESAHVQTYKAEGKTADLLTGLPDARVIIPAGGFTRA
ncbi:125f923d-4244-4c9f-8a2e-43631b9fe8e2 [Sclerotinia trifoliorum]|uniref:125f923d-4244-4c9f-8a2e-43631b9fe8e2 n=1 Tax=Sclerotinia trifoliorum TaxID=28548 RepID=A0A8H2VST0_9HELO|nr:125f923d-4244-4c9f-8a2e-43631b9fe8e2 [Sclerotinia trifoliorum]